MLQLDYGLRTGLAVLTAGMCLALAGPAASKTVYAWETEDGVSSFTDDAKHVPKRYKGAAKRQTLRDLRSYERFTPSDRKAAGEYVERMRSRLSERRETARAHAPMHRMHHRGKGMGIQVSGKDRGAVTLRSGHRDKGIVHVEDRRIQVSGEIATRHETVIKQGDRVLSVIRGEANESALKDVPTVRDELR